MHAVTRLVVESIGVLNVKSVFALIVILNYGTYKEKRVKKTSSQFVPCAADNSNPRRFFAIKFNPPPGFSNRRGERTKNSKAVITYYSLLGFHSQKHMKLRK
jgi:hypothetical protein